MDKLTTDPKTVALAIETIIRKAKEKPASARKKKLIPLLEKARKEAAGTRRGKLFMPRNPVTGQVQAAMAGHETANIPAVGAIAPFEPFSNSDPGWAEVALALLDRLIRGKAKFVDFQTATDFQFKLSNTAGVALFGDWGTGKPAAERVANQIDARKPDTIVHLGDIYYAGEEEEAEDRFLKKLPRSASITRKFALNGNHEMYSGGHGYFEKVLPALGQPASYFCLMNDHWRLIGLDSAFDDKKYKGKQMTWLRAQLVDDGRKNVLMTHHQGFSVFEAGDVDGEIFTKVKPLVDAGKIHAWFWGHEHKHVIYGKHQNVLARCIGHGAIPYSPPVKTLPVKDVPVAFVNRRTVDGAHCVNGFAMLEFDGPRLHVTYVDDDGGVAFEEDLDVEIAKP